jgi:predicted amidohydrolase
LAFSGGFRASPHPLDALTAIVNAVDSGHVLMSVAVAQIPVRWSVESNLGTILNTIAAVDPGTVLVLPEAALSGYDGELSGLTSLDPEDVFKACGILADAARRAAVHVFCGALLFDRGSWWNAAIYFPPEGDTWTYRKVNLALHERGKLAAGSELPTVTITLPGENVTTGVQMCREIRFPEQWNCLARQGAKVLIYMTYAANPAQTAGVWRAHLVSRAAETQRFVLAANVADPRQHCPSMVISPRGEVLAESTDGGPLILRHQINLAEVRDDYLSQQRGDLVSPTGRPY